MYILDKQNANGGDIVELGATGLCSCSWMNTEFQHDFGQIILFIWISDLAIDHSSYWNGLEISAP